MRSSSIFEKWGRLPFLKNEVVLHLPKILRSTSIWLKIWSQLPFVKIYWGWLPVRAYQPSYLQNKHLPISKYEVVFHLPRNVRSSSIWLKCEVVFHLTKMWGRLPFAKIFWGRLPVRAYQPSYLPNKALLILRRVAGWPGGRPAGRVVSRPVAKRDIKANSA